MSTFHNPEPAVDLESRDSLINWLRWNDRHGVYTDEDSEAEGLPPLTLDEALEIYHRTIEENE